MYIPVLELEGTREEIIAQIPDYDGQKMQVSIKVEEKQEPDSPPFFSEAEIERRLAILRRVYENVSQINPKPDTVDWLKEGRAGGMFPDAS